MKTRKLRRLRELMKQMADERLERFRGKMQCLYVLQPVLGIEVRCTKPLGHGGRCEGCVGNEVCGATFHWTMSKRRRRSTY